LDEDLGVRRVLGLEAALRIRAAVHQVISGQVQPGDPVVQLVGEHGPGFHVAGPHDDRDRFPGKGVVDDAAFGHSVNVEGTSSNRSPFRGPRIASPVGWL
jgi:hypothetical protein